MATNPSTATHDSAACCSTPIPSVQASYTPKGQHASLADTTCYVTGPANATKAILFVYDVFGFRAPTLQGADMLASQGYRVIMPDFFGAGGAADPAWMDLPEAQKNVKLGSWMGVIADAQPHIARVHAVADAARTAAHGAPAATAWGAIGFCWGGKIVALTSGPDSYWGAAVQSSPGRIDANDATHVTVPMMMLNSKDEPAEAVQAFDRALTVPKLVETFATQVHGWMSARADLQDAEVVREYERGYRMSLDWFAKYL